jgi:hypothetical protein
MAALHGSCECSSIFNNLTNFEAMSELNKPMLESFMLSGFNFLLYYNLDHFALIVPLKDECETNDNSYIIPIADEQAFEIASGVDQFSFYVLS